MTTFEKFFEENPEQKDIYNKEYNDFLLSEFMLEQMEAQHISVRELSKQSINDIIYESIWEEINLHL